MPIKDAGKKYMRTTATKTQTNRRIRGAFRSAIKSLTTALTQGNTADAKTLYVSAQKALDKAAQKGVIKKNAAARKKSRLNKMVKDASTKA